MNKSESKYYNTAVLMDEALLLLLETKDFDFITIKEICKKAGVNRSTFYLHYQNTNDLLNEAIGLINKRFNESFNNKKFDAQISSKEDSFFITKEYLIPYLTFVKENKRAFKLIHKTINRDNSRSPFQWDNSFNAGFNEGHKTWLKVNSSFQQGINVKEEEQDSDSILKFYQKMIHLRNSNKTLQTGEFIRIKSNRNIAKFYRKSEDETLLIVINLSKKIIKDKRYNSNILISNYKDVSPKVLLPYQGVIYKIK